MKKKPNPTGRPPKNPRPRFDITELYILLNTHLPMRFMTDMGRLDTLKLSKEMEKQRATIYRWFDLGRMSNGSLIKLVEISAESDCERRGFLTKEKLLPFVGL